MPSMSRAAARPRYGVLDVVALLFRELWVMLLVFAILMIGTGAARWPG